MQECFNIFDSCYIKSSVKTYELALYKQKKYFMLNTKFVHGNTHHNKIKKECRRQLSISKWCH